MKPGLIIGMRWARIELVKIVEQWIDEFDDAGSQDSVLRKVYVLKCDCGMLRKIPIAFWPGKRAVQDCGCGIAAMNEGKTTVLVSMPVSMAIAARMAARSRAVGLNQWIRDRIQEGLKK